EKPVVDLPHSSNEQGEMSVVGRDARLDAGDPLRQPTTVRDRNEAVVLAVQKQQRTIDRGDVEAPGRGEGEIVVEPALHTWLETRLLPVEHERCEVAREHGEILGPEQRPVELDEPVGVELLLSHLLEQRAQRRLALERLAELDMVV